MTGDKILNFNKTTQTVQLTSENFPPVAPELSPPTVEKNDTGKTLTHVQPNLK